MDSQLRRRSQQQSPAKVSVVSDSSSPPKSKSEKEHLDKLGEKKKTFSHHSTRRTDKECRNALLIGLVLTLAALATRFWLIWHPNQVVFDEVHFGKFGSYYLRREYYFDVHPPLGKMLIGGTQYMAGYNGSYLFDKIGDDYQSHGVPYVEIRSVPALFGALLVPLVFGILFESGHHITSCVLGSSLVLLDTALLAQSRLILLDSFLIFFDLLSVYSWIKFYQKRSAPFSLKWWFWLSFTGVSIAFATGVKLVGLFAVTLICVVTLWDLWQLADYRRGLTSLQLAKHFFARFLCLAVLPTVLYISFFGLHFAICNKTGPGDSFMTPAFQSTLLGSRMNKESFAVTYGSNVTFLHYDTNAYLHSHPHSYPLRYDDNRVSSQGQQVTGYPHMDSNNKWKLFPVDGSMVVKDEKGNEKPRIIQNEDIVRIQHVITKKFLLTHDVASPLTPTHQEVTCIDEAKTERFNETLWKVIMKKKTATDLTTIDTRFRLVHVSTGVNLHAHKGHYGEWGFGQQEVNGNKGSKDKNNFWLIDNAESVHEPIPAREAYSERRPGLLSKFFELQGAMLSYNAGLTKSHPFMSHPITWPTLVRGISFWNGKDGDTKYSSQIYLIGNPVSWWLAISCVGLFVVFIAAETLASRRGIETLELGVKRRLQMVGLFFFGGWLLHYFPFFIMGRSLYLHHYLPALVYSFLVCAHLFDIFLKYDSGIVRNTLLLLLLGAITFAFGMYLPFSYGFKLTGGEIDARKLLDTWDFARPKN